MKSIKKKKNLVNYYCTYVEGLKNFMMKLFDRTGGGGGIFVMGKNSFI